MAPPFNGLALIKSKVTMKKIVILIPVFNEEKSVVDNLTEILKQARAQHKVSIHLLLVDDGSGDNTVACLRPLCEVDNDVHLLCLNRNFGKEAAIHAGLNRINRADAVIVMDSDLQHPPSLIPKMIDLWIDEGFDVIEACKKSRGKEPFTKKLLVRLYYAFFELASGLQMNNQSDFKLLDKKVVDAYCDLPEVDRFFRGLVNWMHFETAQIYFDVPVTHERESSWSRWRLAKYAVLSITSFTSSPLQIVTFLGIVTLFLSAVIGAMTFYQKLSGQAIDGFTTVILLILFIGSILMLSLGLIGVYVAKIYNGIKNRPAYLVNYEQSHIKEDEL